MEGEFDDWLAQNKLVPKELDTAKMKPGFTMATMLVTVFDPETGQVASFHLHSWHDVPVLADKE